MVYYHFIQPIYCRIGDGLLLLCQTLQIKTPVFLGTHESRNSSRIGYNEVQPAGAHHETVRFYEILLDCTYWYW